ncbi:hypothetical protein DFH09DRAFT_1073296 [Mycena vulgaris]|nr:hypothetical protein DFH09DRAFT_1073296 [Mycena vulgaris]
MSHPPSPFLLTLGLFGCILLPRPFDPTAYRVWARSSAYPDSLASAPSRAQQPSKSAAERPSLTANTITDPLAHSAHAHTVDSKRGAARASVSERQCSASRGIRITYMRGSCVYLMRNEAKSVIWQVIEDRASREPQRWKIAT